MITSIIELVIICLLCFALFFSIKRNLEYFDKLEELGNQIDESLDILNDCYSGISKIAEHEVFSDEPLVRQLISEIKTSKDAILLVANKLVIFDDSDESESQ